MGSKKNSEGNQWEARAYIRERGALRPVLPPKEQAHKDRPLTEVEIYEQEVAKAVQEIVDAVHKWFKYDEKL
jgi:hypothetical protein